MRERPVLWTGIELAEALGRRWDSPAGEAVSARGLSVGRLSRRGDVVLTAGDATAQGALLAEGAAAVLAAQAAPELARAYPVLAVGDLKDAIERLAIAARARSTARVVAITGSAGKSWTTQALGYALSRQQSTTTTSGNLNAYDGVATSLATLPRTDRYGVFELGMSRPGFVLPKARLVRPHVAVVTTIAPVHIRQFRDLAQIAETKGAICEAIEPEGTVVLPRDSPQFPQLLEIAHRAAVATIVTFGRHDDAIVRVVEERLDGHGSDIVVELGGERHDYRLQRPGAHFVSNSLAVLAAAHAVGADWRQAAQDMSDARPMHGRGYPRELRLRDGAITVLEDTYSSNPASVRAALEVLRLMEPRPGSKRVLVISDMTEHSVLGDADYEDLVQPILKSGADYVVTMGRGIRLTRAGLPAQLLGPHCETHEAVRDAVLERVVPGDVVFFKGCQKTDALSTAAKLFYAAAGPQ